jgi:hypothetical protein
VQELGIPYRVNTAAGDFRRRRRYDIEGGSKCGSLSRADVVPNDHYQTTYSRSATARAKSLETPHTLNGTAK